MNTFRPGVGSTSSSARGDGRSNRSGRGLDERGFAGDGHRLFNSTDRERGVHDQERRNADDEPFAHVRGEAAQFGAQGVGARLDSREVVLADRVRNRSPRTAGVLVAQRHRDAGEDATVGVLNDAANAALERLGKTPVASPRTPSTAAILNNCDLMSPS